MPYKDKAKRAEAVRRHRAKRRAASAPVPAVIPPFPSDPSGELARWSRDVLKVPVGHPRAGEPMILPGVSIKLETEVSFDLQALWAHDPAGRAAAFSKLFNLDQCIDGRAKYTCEPGQHCGRSGFEPALDLGKVARGDPCLLGKVTQCHPKMLPESGAGLVPFMTARATS